MYMIVNEISLYFSKRTSVLDRHVVVFIILCIILTVDVESLTVYIDIYCFLCSFTKKWYSAFFKRFISIMWKSIVLFLFYNMVSQQCIDLAHLMVDVNFFYSIITSSPMLVLACRHCVLDFASDMQMSGILTLYTYIHILYLP